MKKSTMLFGIVGLWFASGAAMATTFSSSNFTMIGPTGDLIGGTNDVTATWDDSVNTSVNSTNFNMSLSSPTPFFGLLWTAHHIRVFGPGNYAFDTTCTVAQLEAGVSVCNNPPTPGQTQQFLTMNVGPNQLGAHMLVDWGFNTNLNIAVVWNEHSTFAGPLWTGCCGTSPSPANAWDLTSVDGNGDNVPGIPMINGPFLGFNANFNLGGSSLLAVTLNIPGGTIQECSSSGGSAVPMSVSLSGADAAQAAIAWSVDGQSAGAGPSISPFLSLGNHSVTVDATTADGRHGGTTVSVRVVDTHPPMLNVAFVDSRTGQVVTSIDRANVSWIAAQYGASDVCDPTPVVTGFGGFPANNGDLLKVQGNTDSVVLKTPYLDLTVPGKDASGNTASGQARLNFQ